MRAAWLKGRPYDADKLGRLQWADQVPLLSPSLAARSKQRLSPASASCPLNMMLSILICLASRDAHDSLIGMDSMPPTRRSHSALIRHNHNRFRVCRRRRKAKSS